MLFKSVGTEYINYVYFTLLMVVLVLYSLLRAEYRGLNFYRNGYCQCAVLLIVLHDILCDIITLFV